MPHANSPSADCVDAADHGVRLGTRTSQVNIQFNETHMMTFSLAVLSMQGRQLLMPALPPKSIALGNKKPPVSRGLNGSEAQI